MGRFTRFVISLATLLGVVTLIWYLGLGWVADPDRLLGRESRFALNVTDDAYFASWVRFLMSQPHFALGVPLLAAWLGLRVAHSRVPRIGFLCAVASLVLVVGGVLSQLSGLALHRSLIDNRIAAQLSDQPYALSLWCALGAAPLLLWPMLLRLCRRWRWLSAVQPTAQVSPWAFERFALLTSTGALWLLDYAARGPATMRWTGLYFYTDFLVAIFLYVLAAGLRVPILTLCAQLLARLTAPWHGQRWQKKTVQMLLWGVVLGLMVGLVWFGRTHENAQSVTSELLRAPMVGFIAWVLYRWLRVDGDDKLQRSAVLLAVLILALFLAALFWLTHDNGPVMVAAYAIGVLLLAVIGARLRGWKMMALMLATLALVACVHLLLQQVAPKLSAEYRVREQSRLMLHELAKTPSKSVSVAGSTNDDAHADIKQAPTKALVSGNDFLLKLHWFMRAAPTMGYGLGQVPWCGLAANLGGDRCDGLHKEIYSDYAITGLVGTFGAAPATLVLLVLCWSLWRMISGSLSQNSANASVVNPIVYGRWLVAVFATFLLSQTAISVLGNLAVITLTGVNLPLLTFGKSALWVTAVMFGLAEGKESTAGKKKSLPKHNQTVPH